MSTNAVRPGDLLYTRRPKGYQTLAALAGDTWRHIGLATTVAGFTWVLEMAPPGYLARPLSSIIEGYDTVAVQRLSPCDQQCHITLLNSVAADMNTPTKFHDRKSLAGLGLMTLSRLHSAAERWHAAIAPRIRKRPTFADRAICSTPIARNLDRLCEAHGAVLDVRSPKAHGPQPGGHHTDHQFAMPDDIWRALQETSVSKWLKKDGEIFATREHPDIDLTDDTEGSAIMTLGW